MHDVEQLWRVALGLPCCLSMAGRHRARCCGALTHLKVAADTGAAEQSAMHTRIITMWRV